MHFIQLSRLSQFRGASLSVAIRCSLVRLVVVCWFCCCAASKLLARLCPICWYVLLGPSIGCVPCVCLLMLAATWLSHYWLDCYGSVDICCSSVRLIPSSVCRLLFVATGLPRCWGDIHLSVDIHCSRVWLDCYRYLDICWSLVRLIVCLAWVPIDACYCADITLLPRLLSTICSYLFLVRSVESGFRESD